MRAITTARRRPGPLPAVALACLVGWGVLCTAAGQEAASPSDPWAPLRSFVGSWKGNETGVSGIGTGERTYEWILDERFLLARNRSTFPPQEKNPEGEVHEDWGIFSHDESRGAIVLRQFVSEGFVNRYVLEHDSGSRRLVFTSESVENGPPGLRTRLTLTLTGDDTFEEVFELAGPGGEFRELLRNSWTRTAP